MIYFILAALLIVTVVYSVALMIRTADAERRADQLEPLRSLVAAAEVNLVDLVDCDALWNDDVTEAKVVAHNRAVELIRRYVDKNYTEEQMRFYRDFREMYLNLLEVE